MLLNVVHLVNLKVETNIMETSKRVYKSLKTRIAPILAVAIREKREKLKEVGKVLRSGRKSR